ncbi:MAG: tetratricopeptide repeat protein [Desulfobacteraceae bacterium]|nr:tetratricopeptide repeat protein [Desulfobacteraceae bacterium]
MKSSQPIERRKGGSAKWAACAVVAAVGIAALLFANFPRSSTRRYLAPPRSYPIDPIRITYAEKSGETSAKNAAQPEVPVEWLTGIVRQKQIGPEDFDRTLNNVIATYSRLQQDLGRADNAHPEIASFVAGAGDALHDKDFSKAERLLDRAYEKQAEGVRRLADDLEQRRIAAAQTAVKVGDLHRLQLEYSQAVRAYRKALEWIPEGHDAQVAAVLGKWGNAALHAGDYEEAERVLRRRLEIADTDRNSGLPPRYEALDDLGATLQYQGRHAEAETVYRNALQEAEKVSGASHPRTCEIRIRLAFVMQAQGDFGEAERLCRQTLKMDESTIGLNHPDYAAHVNVLAAVVQAQGRLSEAERLYRRAAGVYGALLGKGHPARAVVLNNLAGVVGMQGRMEEAESLYRQVLEIDAETVGKEHPNYVKHLNNLAALLQARGRLDEAEVLYRRAITIGEAVFPPGAPQRVTLEKNLAAVVAKNEGPQPSPPEASPPHPSQPPGP